MMTPDELKHAICYPSAQQARENANLFLETPQTLSPTYKLAFDDTDFWCGKICGESDCNWR